MAQTFFLLQLTTPSLPPYNFTITLNVVNIHFWYLILCNCAPLARQLLTQESKVIRQWPINWCTSPMMMHKITRSVDYNKWLNRLDTQLNEPSNQNSKISISWFMLIISTFLKQFIIKEGVDLFSHQSIYHYFNVAC